MNTSDTRKPPILAMDLEGVLVPEIWIAVADRSGISDLRLTTRDLPDYDRLMRNRIRILHEHRLALRDIQEVIGALEPYPGALEFLGWVRSKVPVVILSDTYYEFAAPIMEKLGHPALFCNTLELDEGGSISGYRIRQQDGKRRAIRSFGELGFRTLAVGDSYNDTGMLLEADLGLLFRPPENVRAEFPQLRAFESYGELREFFEKSVPFVR